MVSPVTTTLIVVSTTLFLVGLLIGWIYSKDSERTTKKKVKTMVAIVVTLGWISATTAEIFVVSYTVSPLLHGLMGAIVGYFFTDEGINLNIGGSE
jgi:uncharacterized membrane protein